MSEKNPQPKDRSNITSALIGAGAVVLTAVITSIVAPVVLRSLESSPTPIIVTATPPPTVIAQNTSVPPTATLEPTVRVDTPTRAPTATEIIFPTAPTATTALRAASATPPPSPIPPTRVPPTPTQSNIITFLLINNLPRAMEFFVDGESLTRINSGAYQMLKIPRGTRELKQCVLGSDYSASGNCFARTYDLAPNPDVWEMFDSNNPLTTGADSVLLVLNRAAYPQDIYLDNQLVETIQGGAFVALTVSNGSHTLQTCAPNEKPPSGACGRAFQDNYRFPTHYYVILGETF